MDPGSSGSQRTEEARATDQKQATHLCEHCDVIRQLDDVDPSDSCFTTRGANPAEHGCGFARDRDRIMYRQLNYFRKDTLPDLPALQELSDKGCAFCRLLIAGVKETASYQKVGESDPDLKCGAVIRNLRYEWQQKRLSGQYQLRALVVSICLECDHDIFFHISSLQGGACARFLEIPADLPLGHPLSERAIAGMKSWISWCVETCHPLVDGYVLPTRLIDVGESEGKDPRLVKTSTIPEQRQTRKYAALSYCWGPPTERTLKTESKSLKSHLEGIGLQRFPNTIRDAILITRALDIQYLWVDALCIIQDDPEDWATEASRMADVYRNAYVTLVPYMSQSCDDGFLETRSSRPRPSIEIPFKSSISPSTTGGYFLHSARHERDYFQCENEVLNSPWRSRGWTMQEEQLSSRKLMFGADMTILRCSNAINSDRHVFEHYELSTIVGSETVDGPEDKMPLSTLHWVWIRNMTEVYTGRNLSDLSDKLPAVSGFAKVFHEKLHDQYIAGLWRSSLHCGLLWRRETYTNDHLRLSLPELLLRPSRPTPYIAPTWSWASWNERLRGPISEGTYERGSGCRIIDAQITLGGTDPFGRIEAAYLTLEGKCMAIHDPVSKGVTAIDRNEDGWVLQIDEHFILCFVDWDELSPAKAHMDPDFLKRVILIVTAWVDKMGQLRGLMLYHLDEVDEWIRIGMFDPDWYGEKGSDDLPPDIWKTRTVKIV